ncbi:MAG TPA: ATP-binding protein [Alphaproteobacteria bacterium]|nr:ATP-binding protein [Alphaproteobacteria bacterium]HNS44358.1 ATP-binding protein [Alphaproteobacteria bacterium]
MADFFSSPIDLRKKASPVISIYGDVGHSLTRMIWELIPGYDVTISNPATPEALYEEAYDSAMVFVVVGSATDENLEIANKLSSINGVVADIIAITPEPDIRKRLHILAAKFDAIYNLDILSTQDFVQIFHHKLKKGIMRLHARLQEDEYTAFLGFLSVSADAFIVFDQQKRIFYVSEHYLRLYPRSREIFVRGTPVQRVFDSISREMGVGQHDPRYQAALQFWSTLKGQFEFMLDSGTHLRMTAVELPHKQGTIVSTTNITTYKNQEFALEKQQQELERALAAEQEAGLLQKQFISMVSHEFRTPLAIIDGNAQLIQRMKCSMPEEEMTKRLKTIRAAVSRTVNMMEAVLSSNLLKTGKLDLNREDFDFANLVTELCEEQRNLARGHNIQTEISMTSPVVNMDKKFITIILTNLLSNAVKFTDSENGVVQVTVSNTSRELIVKVKDNGIGIPEDEIDNIFMKFYRATTSSGIAGSGVGLSLVKELTHLHKGRISVKSKLGEGALFTLNIPQDFPLEQGAANR